MTDPRHAARYRKGVILGLTIAEVFALIVFLLLIMLAVHGELKRKAEEVATSLVERQGTGAAARLVQAAERMSGGLEAATTAIAALNAGGTLTPAGDLSTIARQLDALSPAQLALMADPAALDRAVRLLAVVQTFQGGTRAADDALKALARGGIVVPKGTVQRLAERLARLPDSELALLSEDLAFNDALRLLKAARLLPGPGPVRDAETALQTLASGGDVVPAGPLRDVVASIGALPRHEAARLAADIAAAGGIEEAATYLAALAALTTPQREAALAEVSRGDLVDALAREAEVSASDRLEQALGQARARMAEAVGAKLAAVVARSDGVVDASDGAITFSRDTLFGQGEDSVGPAQARVLDEICAPWIEALCSSSGNVIGEIRIEGHASSEWDTDSERIQAYLKNLELSQKRASAVLAYCLGKMSGPIAMVDWARGRMVAIGHSSSRVILDPATGAEDRELSRRVVLRADIDRDRLLDRDAGARSTAPACSGG